MLNFFPIQAIYNTQRDAAGIYECIVHEEYADYPLVTAELIVIGVWMDFFFTFFMLMLNNFNLIMSTPSI